MVVGYVKSRIRCIESCDMQEKLIRAYCKKNDIDLKLIYRDEFYNERTKKEAITMRKNYGIERSYKQEVKYKSWDNLYIAAYENKISQIVVDCIQRLYTNQYQYSSFMKLCEEKNIKILEVCNTELDFDMNPFKKNVALYHYTNAKVHPIACENIIDKMYLYVSQKNQWNISGIYLDTSLKKAEQNAYQHFHNIADRFDVLFANDFHHIESKIGPFMKEIEHLNNTGVKVDTLIDGSISFIEKNEVLNKKMNVAVYHSKFRESEDVSVTLQNEIFKAFIHLYTNWTLIDFYVDYTKGQRNGEQKELGKLIRNKDKYDLVLISSMSKINWRTIAFTKQRAAIGLPIYSLREGYLNEQII